jgi:hypothetical protein
MAEFDSYISLVNFAEYADSSASRRRDILLNRTLASGEFSETFWMII